MKMHPITTLFLSAIFFSTPAFSFHPNPQVPAQELRFQDVTQAVNLGDYFVDVDDPHATGAVFADLDGDGDPDLGLPMPASAGGGFGIYENRMPASSTFAPLSSPADPLWLVSGSPATPNNVIGALALDYDNDGDLDLFLVCHTSVTLGNWQDYRNPPASGGRNILLENQGNLSFVDVTGTTDPDPGKRGDGHGLAYTEEPEGMLAGATQLERDSTTTFIPSNTIAAAAADVNRDGFLDIFYAHHFKTFGWAPGAMAALYLGDGNHPSGNHVFWDVTYDRSVYPDAYPGAQLNPHPGIHWEEYLPVFGTEGADLGHPDNFLLPRSGPYVMRFGNILGATFTDLNGDHWPDLVVATKGNHASGAFGLPITSLSSWLLTTQFYLNRGNDPQGKWLGFWNRTWDLYLSDGGDEDGALIETHATMGIAVGDSDLDGDMDFYITDGSDPRPPSNVEMGNAYYENRTETGDLDLYFSGKEIYPLYQPGMEVLGLEDFKGSTILPCWFSWGTFVQDLDNDGDPDAYVCAKTELGEQTTGELLLASMATMLNSRKWVWDRVFRNESAQNAPGVLTGDQIFTDFNPDPTLATQDFTFIPWRRGVSINVVTGDMEGDGRLDFLVLPDHANKTAWNDNPPLNANEAGWAQSPPQFLKNTSSATDGDPAVSGKNNWLSLALSNDYHNVNACKRITASAVGTHIVARAELQGSGGGTYNLGQELRVGEANGASTHSYPLEVGLGNHASSSGSTVPLDITWPCGHAQTIDQDTDIGANRRVSIDAPHHVCPPSSQFSNLSFTTPQTQVGQPYPAGMEALIVEASGSVSGSDNQEMRAVELSLRKSASDVFRPVRMDHSNSDSPSGKYEFPVTALMLASDHKGNGVPEDVTYYEAKLRYWDQYGNSATTQSQTGPPIHYATLLAVRPELLPNASIAWSDFGGTATLVGDHLNLPAQGDSAKLTLEFPGWTDTVEFSLPIRVSSTNGNGSLSLSFPSNTPVVQTLTTISLTRAAAKTYPSSIDVLPTRKFEVELTVTNTSSDDITVEWLKRARKSPSLH